MGRQIAFLHSDFTLAKQSDADIIKVTEENGDELILMVTESGAGDLNFAPDDVVISADEKPTEVKKDSGHARIIKMPSG